MNPLSSLLRLFESADQKKARVAEELTRLRAQVKSRESSSSVSYHDTFSNQKIWVRIGQLEKQLARLNGAPATAK